VGFCGYHWRAYRLYIVQRHSLTLVASSGERQTLPAVKDAVFVVAYAVLLIVAAKSV